jgi:NAD(P)H-hydrate epimerase
MQPSLDIPVLSREQMVEVDRLMIEEYQISLQQMMENAGRNLAEMARRILGGRVAGRCIAVLCGAGNNGGGGLAAARHLHNWGAGISLVLAFEPARFKEITFHQWRILHNMGFASEQKPDFGAADLIIDALIGYGLRGDPRQPIAGWIEKANLSGSQILALDAPSGLDTTNGIPGDPCIKAGATLTLALPKSGLFADRAADFVGELYLADISVPLELYRHMGIDVPNLFKGDSIVRVSFS